MRVCIGDRLTAHQFSVKVILRTPATTATVLMQKNQKANKMMKIPDIVPTTRTISPSGMEFCVKAFVYRILGACTPSETNPAAVYPAGPTETYMPGRVEGAGSELVMSLCMYMAYIISATTQARPCSITAPIHIGSALWCG
jgi:hypothetical protein